MADWPPLKGASFLALFPIYDSTGSLVAAAAGLAACVSKDGAAFAAAACDVAEINANAGLYTLRFSSTEMTADVVAWKVITTSASGRPAIGVMYTAASRQLKDLAWPATAGRSLAVDASGQVDVRALAASAVGASQFASGAIDNAAFNVTETLTANPAASGITASSFTSGAVDNAAFNVTENLNAAVVSMSASVIGASQFAANAIHAAAVAASTLTASKLGAGSIEAATLAASVLSACKFAGGAVDNAAWDVTETVNASVTAIAASAITASVLAANSIHAAAVAASTLSASKLAANSIHAAAIAASALPASKFGASFIELAGLSNAAASFIGTVVRTGSGMGELPVGAPPASPTPEQALMALYMGFRNAASTTSGCVQYTNDGGVVVFQTAISDSGSTFQKGELQSG
jgi:hypothetical protein